MSLPRKLASLLPASVRQEIRSRFRISKERKESNQWLRDHSTDLGGDILSIGSEYDQDGEGGLYINYFPKATSYTTSEVTDDFGTDLVLDVRSMPEIESEKYDVIFCSGVLEHVDDYQKGLAEITRILKKDGILLLGLPFRQAIHMEPHDFWRFTEYGLRYLLADTYTIEVLTGVNDLDRKKFPASYWIRARKQ